ncbi:GAF domain-containing protein [Aureispira anguillae]|uniref:GAF domain-containing protein n=1 Tax=Aureispira anguillae TaxID=2864201 RepID=A0A915YFX1_9BACT|nr:GAF domain-containing protein [Aureispira anguillae]BDS12307.1 GAF domain-containing protein [Aureispira anguillae]
MTIDKHQAYQQAVREINAILEEETNMILKMATINCVLKQYLPYYYWVGFYCVNEGQLMVGPYQGTLGCLHIPFSKGICGRAAQTEKTQVVANVHDDPAHIACDSRTNSEIVLPVWDNEGQLIAVFDIDSTELASFDKVDQTYLEALLELHFRQNKLIKSYL